MRTNIGKQPDRQDECTGGHKGSRSSRTGCTNGPRYYTSSWKEERIGRQARDMQRLHTWKTQGVLWGGGVMPYRPLTIMSPFYRRFATKRLFSMAGWIMLCAHPQMYAGAGLQGVADATYQVLADVEHMTVEGVPCCGGAADIYKFYGQIMQQLVVRHLGAHMSTQLTKKRSTSTEKWVKAMAQLRRLKFVAASPAIKAKTIRTKIYPGLFYGCEARDYTER